MDFIKAFLIVTVFMLLFGCPVITLAAYWTLLAFKMHIIFGIVSFGFLFPLAAFIVMAVFYGLISLLEGN